MTYNSLLSFVLGSIKSINIISLQVMLAVLGIWSSKGRPSTGLWRCRVATSLNALFSPARGTSVLVAPPVNQTSTLKMATHVSVQGARLVRDIMIYLFY